MIGKAKKVMSGFLAIVTVMTSCISPLMVHAAEPETSIPPLYEDVKDMLDADEVVMANDHEVDQGSAFDVKSDFSGINIPNKEKVKVKLYQAENSEGKSFTTDQADTYDAVYYDPYRWRR